VPLFRGSVCYYCGLSTAAEYESIAKDIVGLFTQTFKVDKYELNVDISMGISIYSGDELDPELFIKYAEIALFWAKKEGKNRYKFYSSDVSIQNYKQFELRNDLQKAVDNDQLRIYYQPLVNLKTNELLAVEALIRWEHPDWGIVSPNEFISLAEETGLIINSGNWLLREVCRNYRQWLNDGLPNIKVSVNFSSIQFLENNFVDNIKNTIDEFKLDPHFLIMEITESVIMNNTDKAISDIKRLQSFGIQVALDDFGTGYSSLSYLNSLSIDILKLDESFIKNIPFDDTSSAIVRAVVNLAKDLKIKLVAEGIENWEQLTYLNELNINAGQGYLFSKPLPLEDFVKILVKGKCKPRLVNNAAVMPRKNKRKFFRIKFIQQLEADITILKIRDKKINVGNTKVLINNMGPGGLCFISNIKLPVEKEIILQFITRLMEEEIKVCGYVVWTEEIGHNLHKYGVEFAMDENEREDIIRTLNQVQINMRNRILFAKGSFVSCSPARFFKSLINRKASS